MTAGSWIYIGSQGIVQGTYETFAECANQHFDGSLAGKLVVTAGLGGMGGAQPLSVTMNDGLCLAVEVDPWRIQRRVETGYCDVMSRDLDEALDLLAEAGFDPVYGARPLKRAIQQYLENPLAQQLLVGDYVEGDVIRIDVKEGEISFGKLQTVKAAV